MSAHLFGLPAQAGKDALRLGLHHSTFTIQNFPRDLIKDAMAPLP